MNKEATISWENGIISPRIISYPVRGEWRTISQQVHQVIPDRMACGIPTVYLTLTPSIDTNSSQTGALDSCRLAELNIGIKSGHGSLNKRSPRNFHRNLNGSQPTKESGNEFTLSHTNLACRYAFASLITHYYTALSANLAGIRDS